MYAAQPIISDIGATIGIPVASSGVILTFAQVGYCAGVLFLVPLGDAFESRRLVLILLVGVFVSLLMLSQITAKPLFLGAMFCLGLCSSAVQLVIPFSIGLMQERNRGKFISLIVAGAALGQVVGRPAATWLTGEIGWRTMYLLAAVLVGILTVLFRLAMPKSETPSVKVFYPSLFVSMGRLFASRPKVRAQTLLMTLNFTGFTLFWSALPILMTKEMHLGHNEIALISLASLASPLAVIGGGFLTEKLSRLTIIGVGVGLCFLAFALSPLAGVAVLTALVSIALMDSGMNLANVFIQQSLMLENDDARSRLNALLISFSFVGGSLGSYFGPFIYQHYGWTITALIGTSLYVAAFAVYLRLRRF